MSISKFREFIEKPGCTWIFSIIMVLIMASFIFTGSQCRNQGNMTPNPNASGAVATVGDYAVTEKAIWDMANQSLQSFAQQLGGQVPPGLEATFVGSATNEQVKAGLLLEFAKRKNVDLSDDSVLGATRKAIEEELANRKNQLIGQGKLKADASAAIVDSVMEKEYGQNPKAFQEAVIKSYTEALADPARRDQVLVSSANSLVMEKLGQDVPSSDADIKSFYDLYLAKRVFLKTDAHPGEDLNKKADGILKEIKGGLSFADAMDKYTDDPPGQGKKKHDNEFQVDGKTAGLNAAYEPITKLKAGEIGGPYTLGDGGVSIVQFGSKTSQPPADFDKKKDEYRKNYQRDRAARVLQDGLEALRKENLIKWSSPAYQTLYDLTNFQTDPDAMKLDPKGKRAKLDEFMKRAADAKSDPLGSRAVPLIMFSAFSQIWSAATDAEKTELTPKRIEVLQEVLATTESSELRLELADLLGVKKDGVGVAENLRFAATSIASDFGANGQRVFGDIQARLKKFKDAGIIDAKQEKDVRDVLDQWKKDKAEMDRMEREQKAEQEKLKKEADAATKKDAEKAKTEPKKTP